MMNAEDKLCETESAEAALPGGDNEKDGEKESPSPPVLPPTTAAQPTLWQKLIALGEQLKASGVELPSNLAEHHDYYAHGKPKP
jgi:hypothetical protein